LAALLAKGKWEEASDQVCAQQYESLCAALRDAGYHHYEISNFAQPGYEAVHNSAYWRHEPYIGLGPGAHSFTPGSRLVRQWNESDLGAYIEAGKMGDFAKVCGGEVLTEEQVVLEKVMLGLRTSEGLPEVFLMDHCDTAALAQALSCGNLNRLPQGRIRIPENRFFVSDNIISSLV
jgi:oxygen-independent coproporphyrinogen-3 oxidase